MTFNSNAKIKTIDGRESQGSFEVRRLSNRERMLNGLKWLGSSWGVALIFIPVPFIHFFIPPLFLVLGIPAFFIGYKTQSRIAGGLVECPACHEQISMMGRAFQTDFRDVCPKCANQLYFNLEA